MFVVLGQDSVAHMAEEVENAGTIVPKAMVLVTSRASHLARTDY